MNSLYFFWLVLRSSLFSTSGLGNLPQLYADMTAGGWADESTFAEALAVGQVSPGPSGLWVISLGYLVDGWRGAGLAALAIAVPPALVLVLERVYQRIGGHPATRGFVRGLSLAVVGVFLVTLGGLLRDTGIEARALLLVAASYALALTRRLPVIAILGLAALAGVLLFR
jgi:chromate transporter